MTDEAFVTRFYAVAILRMEGARGVDRPFLRSLHPARTEGKKRRISDRRMTREMLT